MVRYFTRLGNLLKDARIHAELSQNEVAKKLKFEQQFVSSWERGISSPPLRRIEKLASIYQISIESIRDAFLADSLERTRTQIEDDFGKLIRKKRV
jgi:transcriptional regulator with XRE-family HTH domain